MPRPNAYYQAVRADEAEQKLDAALARGRDCETQVARLQEAASIYKFKAEALHTQLRSHGIEPVVDL